MSDFRKRYTPSQVKNMVINPYVAGDIIESYPFLAEMIPEDTMGLNRNKYFRYLSFVYDKNSPMAKDLNLSQRKKQAAADTAFNLDYEKDYHHIAIQFLRFQKSELWTEICCNEMVFWQYAEKVTKPVDESDDKKALQAVELQGKMLEQMMKMRANITALRKEFYGEDKELEQVEEMTYTPENISKATGRKGAV